MSDKLPSIPQNNKNNFIFHKNKLTTSLEILIHWNEEINIENIYLIALSIINNKENPINFIYLSGNNDKDENNIFHYIKINKLKHINYIDFIDWFEELYACDERYLESFKYYAIGFNFEKKSQAWLNNKIYPIYPWNENFKKHFLPKYNLIAQIKKQKIELKRYKIKCINYKKQLKKILRK